MPPRTLNVGDKAPNFTLASGDGKTVNLKDFLGRSVVLYFYPKDNTSGCTKEACDFRDSSSDLRAGGAVVLGVSPDSPSSHEKFAAKFSLPFPLLADPDHKVADLYGVWAEKSMYGRKYFGIDRSTFLIDPEGRIAAIWRKVKVPGHVDEILSRLSGAAPSSTTQAGKSLSKGAPPRKQSIAAASKKKSR